MGEVYLADDSKLARRVALKVPADFAEDPERLKRLQREAQALASLDHPHIVSIYSIEEDQGVHFLTMAYVEGNTSSRDRQRSFQSHRHRLLAELEGAPRRIELTLHDRILSSQSCL